MIQGQSDDPRDGTCTGHCYSQSLAKEPMRSETSGLDMVATSIFCKNSGSDAYRLEDQEGGLLY